MSNRIKELFEERKLRAASFARENDIRPSTLYAILDGSTKFEKISIGTFLKIASGLNMTAEELYYGTEGKTEAYYIDGRVESLISKFESLSDEGKDAALGAVSGIRAAEGAKRG